MMANRVKTSGGVHIKEGGLFRMKYHCPRKGVVRKIRIDAEDFCPICGQRVDWTDPRR